jgi:hypothetical protein
MRTITYEVLPAVGTGTAQKQGTLEVLFSDLYVYWEELIPPLFILNQVLGRGIHDAGMSGGYKWPPFQVTEAEYDELVKYLSTTPVRYMGRNYITAPIPTWVHSLEDWSNWKKEYLAGIPISE